MPGKGIPIYRPTLESQKVEADLCVGVVALLIGD